MRHPPRRLPPWPPPSLPPLLLSPTWPQIYGPLVLPMLIIFCITCIETVGDVTATEEASFLSTTGPGHETRIRGALLNDGGWACSSPAPSQRASHCSVRCCPGGFLNPSRPPTGIECD